MYMYVCVLLLLLKYMLVYVYICVCVCVCMCVYVYVCACVARVCVYVCMRVYVYVITTDESLSSLGRSTEVLRVSSRLERLILRARLPLGGASVFVDVDGVDRGAGAGGTETSPV